MSPKAMVVAACIALAACAGPISRESEFDAKKADALAAERMTKARQHRCEPATGNAPRPMQRFEHKWISLMLPADASRYAFESDDVFDARPKWHGRNWSAHVVINGANLIHFTESDRLCNVSDSEVERNVFFGQWIGKDGAFAILSRQGASEADEHVILSVRLEPDGLTEAEALQIIASAEVKWVAPLDEK
jgi:hypothetical protein